MEEFPDQNPQIPLPTPLPTPFRFGKIFLYNLKNNLKVKIIGITAGIVILIFFVFAALTVYAGIHYPFLGEDQRKMLLSFFYAIPFIPKTNEQILHAAITSNYQIRTYQPDFSFSAQLRNNIITLGSLDLDLAGFADISPKQKSKLDLKVTANGTLSGTKYDLTGKIRKLEDTFYFKIDSLPDTITTAMQTFSGSTNTTISETEKVEIKQNMQNALKNWILYDTAGLITEASKAIEPTKQQSLAESVRTSFENFLVQKDILQEVKRQTDEKVDTVDCYHLQLIPSKPLLIKIVKDYIGLNKSLSQSDVSRLVTLASNGIDNMGINIWIGKGDSLMHKITFASDVDLSQYFKGSASGLPMTYGDGGASPIGYLGLLGSTQFATAKLSLAAALVLNHIGEPITIVTPSPLKTPGDYYTTLINSFKTKEALMREQEALMLGQKQKQQSDEIQAIQTALSTYYADNNVYPSAFSQLQPKDYNIANLTPSIVAKYQYRLGKDGKSYAVYITTIGAHLTSDETPYYGITSISYYPHQLTTSDFNELNKSF